MNGRSVRAAALYAQMHEHGSMPVASSADDWPFTEMDLATTALAALGYHAAMGDGMPHGIGVQATQDECQQLPHSGRRR